MVAAGAGGFQPRRDGVHHRHGRSRYGPGVLRWRRRRSALGVALARVERRLDDIEDLARSALAPDRLDDLAERVEDLALGSVTGDELLEVRLHSARVAVELTRVNAELRAELDRLATLLAAEGRTPLDPFLGTGEPDGGLAAAG